MDIIQTPLTIFQPPPIDKTIQKEYWVEFNPIAAITDSSVIEFNIPGTSVDYINLAKTRLHVKYIITDEKGVPIHNKPPSAGQPPTPSHQVAPINLTLHSIFRQVDIALNQKVVSSDLGANYPYKAMIDFLLSTNNNMVQSEGEAALFHKDQPGAMEAITYTGGNPGFTERGRPTRSGGTASVEGLLYTDFGIDQPRAIINGVAVTLKFFQSFNEFRLMRDGKEKLRLKITEAILKVCYISLNPDMLVAHNEALKTSPALYPFWRSDIKSFSIAKGSHTFMTDNIFHGKVPSKIVVGLVSNAAYSGDYTKNPFNFQNMDLNYMELSVDGQPVPNRPFKPNFNEKDYVASYLSLVPNDSDRKNGLIIQLSDYPKGYALYQFDIQSFLSGQVMTNSGSGHVRLSLRFGTALPETINIIVYAKFPEILKIDQARMVNVG